MHSELTGGIDSDGDAPASGREVKVQRVEGAARRRWVLELVVAVVRIVGGEASSGGARRWLAEVIAGVAWPEEGAIGRAQHRNEIVR